MKFLILKANTFISFKGEIQILMVVFLDVLNIKFQNSFQLKEEGLDLIKKSSHKLTGRLYV
ncbi:MAG: hypothetical protein BGO76_00555 [Caedibacter sp. 38-128]|nr:MAG: hypothetical protein BGO76_00555 [Caedibacter sp. 38-128]